MYFYLITITYWKKVSRMYLYNISFNIKTINHVVMKK